MRVKQVLEAGKPAESAGCLSEGDTRAGLGFGCTGRVKAGSSGCSWDGTSCLGLGLLSPRAQHSNGCTGNATADSHPSSLS